LKQIWEIIIKSTENGKFPADFSSFRNENPAFVTSNLFINVQKVFLIKARALANDNWNIILTPKKKFASLNSYRIDQNGIIHNIEQPASSEKSEVQSK
jgi:hypothetical protein